MNEKRHPKRHVEECAKCTGWYRKVLMHPVYYTGTASQGDFMPRAKVEDQRVLICPDCYVAAGYTPRKQKEIPDERTW